MMPTVTATTKDASAVSSKNKLGGQFTAVVPTRTTTQTDNATLLRTNAGVASFGFKTGFAFMDYLPAQFRVASRH
jgi:hypothetical protein